MQALMKWANVPARITFFLDDAFHRISNHTEVMRNKNFTANIMPREKASQLAR